MHHTHPSPSIPPPTAPPLTVRLQGCTNGYASQGVPHSNLLHHTCSEQPSAHLLPHCSCSRATPVYPLSPTAHSPQLHFKPSTPPGCPVPAALQLTTAGCSCCCCCCCCSPSEVHQQALCSAALRCCSPSVDHHHARRQPQQPQQQQPTSSSSCRSPAHLLALGITTRKAKASVQVSQAWAAGCCCCCWGGGGKVVKLGGARSGVSSQPASTKPQQPHIWCQRKWCKVYRQRKGVRSGGNSEKKQVAC
jgi:hypothetical protein